jgi:deazaflavin-dependent oxidoreductase (nitroreductase family)
MTTRAEYNARLIDEFRAGAGRVGGEWEGTPLLLLHHTGAKSGARRVTPVGYLRDDDRYVVYASNGGAPSDPPWVRNLEATPDTRIEVGNETLAVAAEVATGEARERLFAIGAELFPQLAEYEREAGRAIPVIVLSRQGSLG